MVKLAEELGRAEISKLLIKQAVPASIGILVMSLNMIIDTIFVGQWIGVLAIAAITVVLPIAFMISSIGMELPGLTLQHQHSMLLSRTQLEF